MIRAPRSVPEAAHAFGSASAATSTRASPSIEMWPASGVGLGKAGLPLAFPGPFFKEFTVRCPKDPAAVLKKVTLRASGVRAGQIGRQ